MENQSRRRIAGVAAASWVLATAVTSFVVWRAVAVFDEGASTNVLTAPQVAERLEEAKATRATSSAPQTASATQTSVPATDTPTPTSDDTSSTTEPSSPSTATRTSWRPTTSATTAAAAPVVTTWTVTGGTVSVSCQAQVISLIYASPQDGWRFETEKHGTDRIDINFQRQGLGTELKAVCVNGVPQQTNQPTEGDR